MKIEEGKRYRLKDGQEIGPVVWDDVVKVWRRNKEYQLNNGDYWHENGSRYGHCDDELDIEQEITH